MKNEETRLLAGKIEIEMKLLYEAGRKIGKGTKRLDEGVARPIEMTSKRRARNVWNYVRRKGDDAELKVGNEMQSKRKGDD